MVNGESRGVHDINVRFESDQYPGVIIHDSKGFEAGDTKRLQAFESFLKDRGGCSPARQQLHAVWYAIQPSQTSDTSDLLLL
jgi:hypothetical protein